MSSLTLHPALPIILLLAASVLAAMFATTRVARRRLAAPTLPTQVAELPQQSTPQQTTPTSAAVPAPTHEIAAINCHAMSDAGPLSRCLCGEWSLWLSPLSDRATCHACSRTWCTVGSLHYFVPAHQWQGFAEHNGIAQQGGVS